MIRPPANWRPYSPSSPFNTKIPTSPRVASGSRQQVTKLVAGGEPAYPVMGDPLRPDNISVVWADETDPLVTLRSDWESGGLDGKKVWCPANAMPSGNAGTDAHLTIIQPNRLDEIDLWAVKVARTPSTSGASLPFINGGSCRLDGDGTGSYAVASRFGSLAGLVMTEEFEGPINHALQMFVPYTKGFVWPAIHGGYEGDGPPMGAHFRLAWPKPQIKAAGFPAWKQALLIALHDYGAYVADTTADPSYWGFRFESTASWASFNFPDPRIAVALDEGISADDYNHNGWPEYWFDLQAGVDWSRLQVIR